MFSRMLSDLLGKAPSSGKDPPHLLLNTLHSNHLIFWKTSLKSLRSTLVQNSKFWSWFNEFQVCSRGTDPHVISPHFWLLYLRKATNAIQVQCLLIKWQNYWLLQIQLFYHIKLVSRRFFREGVRMKEYFLF